MVEVWSSHTTGRRHFNCPNSYVVPLDKKMIRSFSLAFERQRQSQLILYA